MPVEDLINKQTTEYSVTRTTLHIPGLAQCPPDDDGACVFVRIHQPMEQLLVQWTAKNTGGPPTVPSPVDPDSPYGYSANLILLDFKFTVPILMPLGGANLGHIWVVSGYVLYGKVTAEGPYCDYKTGTMPWEQTSPPGYPNHFPKENFKMNILDPSPADPLIIGIPNPPGP